MPAPIPQGEAADDPTSRPTVIQSHRRPVEQEVLDLFDPSKQRDRKAPAGTRLIRKKRRPEDEERPAAVPGETAANGTDSAPGPPPDDSKRRKRTSRRLTICTVCTAPFPARELLTVRQRLYCLPCLERRQDLFDADEIAEAKRVRESRIEEGREQEREAAAANPVRRRGTDTKRLAIQRRQAEESLRGQGSSGSHTAIMWPKCPRHPEHSTNDRCTTCRKPVCALCISRQGARSFCPECRGASREAGTSGRYSGFGGSGLDTLKDVLVSPAIFFRSLPETGSIVRPMLFGFIGGFAGALMVLVAAGIWYAADDPSGPLTLVQQRPGPIAVGAALISLAYLAAAVVIHAIAGAVFGGQASGSHAARGSLLACGAGWTGAIPVGGVILWPCFSLTASTAMLRSVHQIHWFFAALGALAALAAQIAAGAAIAHYILG